MQFRFSSGFCFVFLVVFFFFELLFSRIESVEYSAQTELAAGNWPEVILVVKEIQRRHLTHTHTGTHTLAGFAVERVLRQVFVAVCAWAWLVILNVCVCECGRVSPAAFRVVPKSSYVRDSMEISPYKNALNKYNIKLRYSALSYCH